MIKLVGHITLNLSTAMYLVWFIPQVLLNFKRKDTEGLSMLMHGILCIGYLSDLIYGFGLQMQWQYRLVTIVGLISLTIQHYQFGRYGLHRFNEKLAFLFLNFIYITLFSYVIYTLNFNHNNHSFYDSIGMLTNVCWLSYMLPQIFKNYLNKSTVGLSRYFIGIAIFLNVCDMTSAWTLDWDYPSKIGPVIAIVGNLLLLGQVFYYGTRIKTTSRLAVSG